MRRRFQAARIRTWAWRSLVAALALGLASSSSQARGPDERGTLLVGFYDGWDPKARQDLPRRLSSLDVLAPMWVTVRGPQGQMVFEIDQTARAALAARKAPPQVLPVVSNAHDDIWDKAAAEAAILDPGARSALIARLLALAQTQGFHGFILDFENLSPRAQAGYPGLVAALRAALAPSGREAWVTAPIGGDQSLTALAGASDALVLMAYDACWATSTPGPIAGQDWFEQVLARRLQGLDPRRVVLALGSYGYDWPDRAPAQAIGAADAIVLAARTHAKVTRDRASGNPWFAYTNAQRQRHTVWFLDAGTFAAQARTSGDFGARGVALWRLGMEDPGIWSLRRPFGQPAAHPPRKAETPEPHPCDPLPVR
jgi:spore germination protein YaaH